jgi:hypothetical protein
MLKLDMLAQLDANKKMAFTGFNPACLFRSICKAVPSELVSVQHRFAGMLVDVVCYQLGIFPSSPN